MRVWRLMRRAYAVYPLDGEGARLYGGRWNFPGTPVVYTASSLALAALEVLVHVDTDLAPTDLFAIAIDVPDRLQIETITRAMLPANWQRTPAPEQL